MSAADPIAHPKPATNHELLTALLAERAMGWVVRPDRFLLGNRAWIPRWRFRPDAKLSDAFRLLEAISADEFAMRSRGNIFWVRVRVGNIVGEAGHPSKPLAMTLAIARALGLEVDQ